MGFDLTGRQPLRGERDDHRVDPVQAALTLAHGLRIEAAFTIPRHLDVDRTDLGDHPLRAGTVARVGQVTALDRMLRVAEMFFHLDLQASLEDLLRQAGQQPARTDKIDPVHSCLLNQLLSDRPLRAALTSLVRRCRHHHILLCHCLSFQPNQTAQRFRPDHLHRGSDSPRLTVVGDLTVPVVGCTNCSIRLHAS
jgi:hypothetical protein